tara:strand:+ start:518 stop:2374 length:1857 start_codon:yes stop_codon:yes gene_type:complete
MNKSNTQYNNKSPLNFMLMGAIPALYKGVKKYKEMEDELNNPEEEVYHEGPEWESFDMSSNQNWQTAQGYMQDVAGFMDSKNIWAGLENPYANIGNAWGGAKNVFAGAQNQFAGAQNVFAQGQNMYANVQTFGDQLTNPYAGAQNVYDGAQGVMGGATNVYGGVQNAYAGLKNPYDDMTNAYDNVTVNQQQANFQRNQLQAQQADLMSQVRSGGGGMGGLIQMIAGQSAQAAAQTSASIGLQESQINMQRAQEDSRIQQMQRGAAFEIEKLKAQGEQQAELTRLGGEEKLQQMQLGEKSQLQMARLQEASRLQGLDMQTAYDLQKTILGEKMKAQEMKLSGAERFQQMVLSGKADVQRMKLMGAADLQKMILTGEQQLQANKLNAQQALNIKSAEGAWMAKMQELQGEWEVSNRNLDVAGMMVGYYNAQAGLDQANFYNDQTLQMTADQLEWDRNNPVEFEEYDEDDGSCVLSTAAYKQGLIDSKQLMAFVLWRLQTQHEEFLGDVKWLGYQITWKPIANFMLKSKWFARLIKKIIINNWISVINGKKKPLTKFFVEYISVLGFLLNYRKCMKLASKFKNNPRILLKTYKNIIIKNDGNDWAWLDFKQKLKNARKNKK